MRHQIRCWAALLAGAASGCASAAAPARPADGPERGARLRVTTCVPGRAVVIGRLADRDGVALVLAAGPRRDTLALAAVRRIERSAGRRGLGPRAAVGAVAGAALGALAGRGLDAASENRTGDGSGEAIESATLPVLGALVGALGGALAGAASAPERWVPVAAPPGGGRACGA